MQLSLQLEAYDLKLSEAAVSHAGLIAQRDDLLERTTTAQERCAFTTGHWPLILDVLFEGGLHQKQPQGLCLSPVISSSRKTTTARLS